MIYFIQATDGTGPIKIGVAIYPQRRLIDLQAGCPVILKIIKTIEGEQSQELLLHKKFAHLRLHGEWFSPAEELLSFINSDDEIRRFFEAERKPDILFASPAPPSKEWLSARNEELKLIRMEGFSRTIADRRRTARLAIAREIAQQNEKPAGM